MKTQTDNQHGIEVCNKLLRGERSALETYDRAIAKFGSHGAASELRRIREEHFEAVARLEREVQAMGGTPDEGSGAWGSFAKAVQATANLFGQDSALQSLKAGEEFGRGEYESAVDDEGVSPACRDLMRDELLPLTIKHIHSLELLQKAT